MKRLLFSDLHLKPESEDTAFAVLKDIRESGNKKVAFLGDFWHLRYHIPVHLLNRLYEELLKWEAAEIDLQIIPGNHDQIDVVGRNALEIFEAFSNVRVYTDPALDEGILWLPYRKEEAEIQHALNWARDQGVQTVFAHAPIKGALQNNNHPDTDGLHVGTFKGFRYVICGHYHKRQEIARGMAAYVGSPYQTRADEWGQEKGWALWSPETGLEYVTRVFGRRYHRIEDPQPGWLSKVASGDHVKVIVNTAKDAEIVRAGLADHFLHDSVVEVRESEAPVPRFGFTKGTTLDEYAHAYVQANAGELDQKALLDTFAEVKNG